jgi:hypothetical protein
VARVVATPSKREIFWFFLATHAMPAVLAPTAADVMNLMGKERDLASYLFIYSWVFSFYYSYLIFSRFNFWSYY